MNNSRIIVVGAGISGISAAARLIENGFKNVLVLEAENRVGGRVCTVPFASNVVDLGAQWCHGEKDNLVYELVGDKKKNFLSESAISYPNVSFQTSTGRLDDNQCGRLMALCLSILENSSEDLANFKGSLGSYVVAKYEDALKSEDFSDIDRETSSLVLDFFHKFENSIEASDTWFDTSGKGYLEYWECEGHPLLNWRDKGYKTVIDFLTKKIQTPGQAIDVESKILLNKEVSKIDWTNERAAVKCSDGSWYDADHVLVTVSLGVLKENFKTWFSPQLPAYKENAIRGLSFGTVDKIFLEFDKPFWEENWAGFSILWRTNDSQEIRKTENAWLEDVFGFYTVDFQPNILCGWIGGTSARKMETLEDKVVYDGCLYLLEKFIGKQLPWTKPTNIIRSNWSKNCHFRGSYSFRSLATDALNTSASELAKPLCNVSGKPSILFGGEATSTHYYSTVHGAVEAGWREAKRLTDYYTSSIKKIEAITDENVKTKHVDVIVLGAGIAGLGAGEVLKHSNCSFLILEGSERVGGRINTVEMKNFSGEHAKVFVDSGAQWLHGRHNELFKLAEKHNLIHKELSEEAEGDYVRDDGQILDPFFVKKVDFKIGQILEECEAFAGTKAEDFKFPSSVKEFVEENFKAFVGSLETREERDQAMQLLDWHRKFQIIDNSCIHFGDISAKNWGNYSFNGESCQTHLNINNGMSQLVKVLEKSLHHRIKLNEIVDIISWKGDENPTENLIKVKTRSGCVYTTNVVICTFSLGVLKDRHLEMFSPPLPKEHRELIDKIGFGTINKIFLHFDERWWNEDWKGLQLIWKEDHSDESHWTQFISGFDVVYPCSENILLGWIGGQGAIDMEKLSDNDIAYACTELMRKFMKNPNIPQPSKFNCSRWNSNSHVRGAYSFTSRHTDDIRNWEKVLSRPVTSEATKDGQSSKLILLSGEHCHEKYFSTVHGAYHSGQEQANHAINFFKKLSFKNLSLSKL